MQADGRRLVRLQSLDLTAGANGRMRRPRLRMLRMLPLGTTALQGEQDSWGRVLACQADRRERRTATVATRPPRADSDCRRRSVTMFSIKLTQGCMVPSRHS